MKERIGKKKTGVRGFENEREIRKEKKIGGVHKEKEIELRRR